jgi:hypothetical protein
MYFYKSLATIDIAVREFGSKKEKQIWNERQTYIYDGMKEDIYETIINCLQKRYNFLEKLIKSPLNTQDDIAEFKIIMNNINNIISHLQ